MGRKLMAADDYEAKVRELEASASKLEEEKAALVAELETQKSMERETKSKLMIILAGIKGAEKDRKNTSKNLNRTTRERRNVQRKIREKEAEIRALPCKISRYRRIVEKMKVEEPDPGVRERRANRLGEVLDKITGVPGA